MKVLQIGSDRSIFDSNSASASRMRAYGEQFGRLDIIVFSLRHARRSLGAGGKHNVREIRLSEKVSAYPTNSHFRFLYLWDAIRIGFKLDKPDVISVQDPFEAGFVGSILSRLRGVPLHTQVHTDIGAPEFARLSFLNRFRLFIAGFVLRRASRVRVVSERIKRGIEERYHIRAPISVLPIFVDVARFQNAKTEESLIQRFSKFTTKILVVSRLESEKNVSLAIRAFAENAPDDACLIIVGEGRERKNLERLAENLSVSERVFFEGAQSPIKYYKLANLILATSLYEGYGMVIVEALASGVPVLSTDVGVAREVGAIVAPREKFSSALKNWFINGPSTGAVPNPNGPREGVLKNYPYQNFNEYLLAYCADIASCAESKKGHT